MPAASPVTRPMGNVRGLRAGGLDDAEVTSVPASWSRITTNAIAHAIPTTAATRQTHRGVGLRVARPAAVIAAIASSRGSGARSVMALPLVAEQSVDHDVVQ